MGRGGITGMLTYTYEGIGSDGSVLVPGQIYTARGKGGEESRKWIARKTGRIFAMRWWPELTHYELPQHLIFETPPSIDDQFTWWYDEILVKDATEHPHNPISHYDIAALAWHEAWKRATAERGKT
jgi:hypothetical protein